MEKKRKTADILYICNFLQKNRFTACKTDSGRGKWVAHVQESIPPGAIFSEKEYKLNIKQVSPKSHYKDIYRKMSGELRRFAGGDTEI